MHSTSLESIFKTHSRATNVVPYEYCPEKKHYVQSCGFARWVLETWDCNSTKTPLTAQNKTKNGGQLRHAVLTYGTIGPEQTDQNFQSFYCQARPEEPPVRGNVFEWPKEDHSAIEAVLFWRFFSTIANHSPFQEAFSLHKCVCLGKEMRQAGVTRSASLSKPILRKIWYWKSVY